MLPRVKRWEWLSWGGIATLAGLLAVAGLLAWEPTPGPPGPKLYRDYSVCLLTSQDGIQIEPAKTVWQGLKTVSDRTDVRVTYARVTGEQTTTRAQQILASQVAQRCGVIVAVGKTPIAAVAADRDRYPRVKFVTLDGAPSAATVTDRVLPLVPPKDK